MRIARAHFLLPFLLVIPLLPETSVGATRTVGPTDPWCNTINTASPGDEIVFAPGNYPTTCGISVSGTASAPIVLRSEIESAPALFNYPGSSSNIFEVRGAHVTFRSLSFRPSSDAVDAIRIMGGVTNVVVERNRFEGTANIMVSANSGNTSNLIIRDNTLINLLNTPIYIGCHAGECSSTNLLFERNFIDGVSPPDPSIGYGIEVKLNSWGTIRDNTIYRTKGPPIMVYGSNRGDPPNIIEGNYTEGSQNEGGIVIGGGPAIVRNNVLVGNAFGGISAQDYAGRDLQQNVWIVHNTILNNDDSGINVAAWRDGRGNVLAFNAIAPRAGTPALRPAAPTGTIMGNITCSTTPCFVQSTTAPYDLWPAIGGGLVDAAGNGPEAWRPTDDFMGVVRGSAADVGAFERTTFPNNHLVGGGSPRPLRVSADTTPPSSPTAVQVK